MIVEASARQLSGVAAYVAGGDVNFAVGGGAEPIRVRGAVVSAGLFPLLGVRPLVGGGFVPADDAPAAEPVAMLGEDLWRRHFGSATDLVGRTVRLNGRHTTVRGVIARGTGFPEGVEVWIGAPQRAAEALNTTLPVSYYPRAIGRLATGATPAAVNAELAALSAQAPAGPGEGGTVLQATPLHFELTGAARPPLMLLLAAVALVLAMACVNLAHLMEVRALGRRGDTAVRLALGASRWAPARRHLAESGVIAAMGGACGLALGAGAVRALPVLRLAHLPRLDQVEVDVSVGLFALLLVAGVAAAIGALPALRSAATDPAAALVSKATTAGLGGQRVQRAAVISEIALATALLAGAGLAIGGFRSLMARDLGIRLDGALVAKLTPGVWRYPDAERQRAFFDRVAEALSRLPGVEAVGGADAVPLVGGGFDALVTLDGEDPAEPVSARCVSVTGDYFTAIGIPIVAGRRFESGDDRGPATVIVDQVFADRYFGGGEAIGRSIGIQGRPREIIGVAAGVRHDGVRSSRQPQVYVPFRQAPFPWPFLYLVLRTSEPPSALVSAVRSRVRALDPEEPVESIVPLSQLHARALSRERLAAQALGAFAAIALLLAAVGVYGVIAYDVQRNARALAIRSALGALPGDLVRAVFLRGVVTVGAGLAIGLVLALGLGRALAAALPGVPDRDPWWVAASASLLLVVSAAAILGAASRVRRMSPLAALRAE
jgi:predicted permease